jgi:hypothetical protein
MFPALCIGWSNFAVQLYRLSKGAEMNTKTEEFEEFIDRLGLLHFKGSEFTPYWDQVCNGVRNLIPPESLWPKIIPTIIILDRLREEIGFPIQLLSTYRSPAYNTAVGGEPASFHMSFQAIDFKCEGGLPDQWAEKLRSWRGMDFLLPGNAGSLTFHGGIGVYSTFVHVDTRGKDANWTGK